LILKDLLMCVITRHATPVIVWFSYARRRVHRPLAGQPRTMEKYLNDDKYLGITLIMVPPLVASADD
jgi:hypothetical protein